MVDCINKTVMQDPHELQILAKQKSDNCPK